MLEQKTYKNYKQLCKAMNWSTTGGNTKTKYLKELDSLCKWHKEGNKIVIDEIYEEPKEIIDNRYATIDKLPYFNETFPELQKAMYKKDKKGNKTLVSNITLTKSKLLDRVFGVSASKIDQRYKDKIYDIFKDDSIKDKRNYIRSFTLEISNFFWVKVLKNGTMDKLSRFEKGRVNTINCLGIKHKENSVNDNYIIEEIEYRHLDKEENAIVKQIKADMCKRLNKKSIALFNDDEKEELYLLIANKFNIKEEIFLYENYCIDVFDALDIVVDSMESEEGTKAYRNQIFKEFYKQHIEKYYDIDFQKFMIYTTLYVLMYYGNQIGIMPPFEDEQRAKYEKEMGRLLKENKELKKEISALKAENQMLKNKLQNQQN